MANVDIIIRAVDKATATLQGIQSKFAGFTSAVGSLGALAGAAAVGAIAKAGIEANRGQKQAEAALETALKRSGTWSAEIAKQMSAYAGELQYTVGVADDVIIKTQAMLVTFTGLAGDAVKPLTMATLDLAAGLNMDQETAAKLVAKTLAGQDALSRYGISLKGVHGDAERLRVVQEKINELFGGAAKAQADAAGGWAKLGLAMDDALEGVGAALENLVSDFEIAGVDILGILGKVLSTIVEGFNAGLRTIWLVISGIGAGVEWLLEKLGVDVGTFFRDQAAGAVQDLNKVGQRIIGIWSASEQAAGGATAKGKGHIDDLGEHSAKTAKKVAQAWRETIYIDEKQEARMKAASAAWEKALKFMAQTKDVQAALWKEYRENAEKAGQVLTTVNATAVAELDQALLDLGTGWSLTMEAMGAAASGMAGVFHSEFMAAFENVFGKAHTLLGKLLTAIIDAIAQIAAKLLASAIVSGFLSFITGGGLAFGAIFGGLTGIFHSGGIVPKAHGGMVTPGSSSQEYPILVRGGETIRTEDQERELRRSKSAQGGGLHITIVNQGQVVDGGRFVMDALKAVRRETGLSVETLTRGGNTLRLEPGA